MGDGSNGHGVSDVSYLSRLWARVILAFAADRATGSRWPDPPAHRRRRGPARECRAQSGMARAAAATTTTWQGAPASPLIQPIGIMRNKTQFLDANGRDRRGAGACFGHPELRGQVRCSHVN